MIGKEFPISDQAGLYRQCAAQNQHKADNVNIWSGESFIWWIPVCSVMLFSGPFQMYILHGAHGSTTVSKINNTSSSVSLTGRLS